MTMEDPPLQKPLKSNKKKIKRSKNSVGNESNPKEAIPKKTPKKKIRKAKENRSNNKINASEDGHSDVFVFDEIANNKDASALISALVNCYTCNCTLPQSELDTLKKTLYDKTVSVFLHILNKCVNKIYNKLLKTPYITELIGGKVARRDAFCQTDISYDN